MRGLYSKVSDPLNVRHRLDCIAEGTIWTYMHTFMCNTGNEIVKCQLQNAKSNFPKLCKVYARQNQRNKSDTFTHKFSRNHQEHLESLADTFTHKFSRNYQEHLESLADTFTHKFSRNHQEHLESLALKHPWKHCFNFLFKGRFQEAFLVKVIYTKKYTTCT